MAKKKILLLADDLRFPSGVGNMSREIVLGTVHHFDWVQIGAAIKHPDEGKILDLSESVNKELGQTDAYVKIYPSSGYGNIGIVRRVLEMEKPDAIMIFTDPRYWSWLFAAEREIRTKMPLIYLNIWDDLPYPMYNRGYYESCDGLLAISKQTRNINIQVLQERAAEKVIRYVPHGVGAHYSPLDKADPALLQFKQNLIGNENPEFTLLYNARNLGRKQTSNIILAWRHFCDKIGKEKARKCLLLMHTDVADEAGTDLGAVCEAFCDPDYVKVGFATAKFSIEDMNKLYNVSDGVILASSNEGWGLSLTEALATGKMFIAPVTGGMQDQMRFEDENGNWLDFTKDFPSNHTGKYRKHGEWCIPLYPENRSCVGSITTPYIYDDRCSIEQITAAILELYNLPAEERARRGEVGRQWACSDEAGFTAKQMSERIIEGIEATIKNNRELHPRKAFEIYQVSKYNDSTYIDYDPVQYK